MNYHHTFFLFILLFAGLGCDSGSDPSPSNDVIIPLAVNNEWVYSETDYDTTGAVRDQRSYSWAIVRDSTRLGEKIYIDQNGFQYANRADGHWYLTHGYSHDEQLLAFKYPCKVGDTFPRSSFNYAAGVGDVVTMTVESLGARVTVPAGTYDCIKYVGEGYLPSTGQKTDRRIFYLAPNVGIIMIEDYDYIPNQNNPPLAFRIELTRVTLQ